ncbi:hypothetical protein AX15_000212 [Amanita polypyramis BW_CC]|nr:hypothetical protein AX15_000212 [Amanita polypyramis BW_CC]
MPKRRVTTKPPVPDHDDYGMPTDEEWVGMIGYQSFVVTDEEGGEHTFRRGDVALILPYHVVPDDAEDLDDSEFWVAKIRDIRARPDQDVWVKVQWYYSPSDAARAINSLWALLSRTVAGCYIHLFFLNYQATREHAENTKEYFQTTLTMFTSIASVKHIGTGQFYYRYNFEYSTRKLQPKQNTFACPQCDEIYSPDDSDANNLMHFCPRPSCRKFYHQGCLDVIRGEKHSSRTLQLITTWPDTDEKLSLSELLSPRKQSLGRFRPGGVPRQRKTTSSVVVDLDPDDVISGFLGLFPDELIRVAEQPIVRGAAFTAGGVAGNISYVALARRMIYEALHGSSVPDDWPAHIVVSKSVVDLKIGAKKRTIPGLVCPECKSFI